MSDILPLMTTDGSIGRSILTVDEPEEINNDTKKPISIFSISKKYSLQQLFVVDSSLVHFIKMYKLAEKLNIQLCFGIKLVCCDDITQKNEESRKSEHKIIVWLKDSAGYSNFCKIFSASWLKGMYYVNRIDFKTLNELWDDRYFSLFCDSYNGFLSRNLLEDYICNPNFGDIRPTLTFSTCNLPFDPLIENAVKKYVENNKLEVIHTHPIYYYSRKDAKPWLIRRCIDKRSKWSCPNLSHAVSDNFCFQAYWESIGNKF